ncbi:hypothetical protein Hypma_012141 [Hypsizygus marmoreus]|uniref:Uncharacterized protein n=1 Tax=Hypsizygus marmoreus TaxID=39966 RepID=A0A369JJX0_HYPMA|nr:hypothetical protein Hypma_012141 [Hypsizygus marmoreus]
MEHNTAGDAGPSTLSTTTNTALSMYTVADIKTACHGIFTLTRDVARKRELLINAIGALEEDLRGEIVRRLRETENERKRKQPPIRDQNTRRRRHVPTAHHTTVLESTDTRSAPSTNLEDTSFLDSPSTETINQATIRFIKRTGNEALRVVPCVSCARETDASQTKTYEINDIPSPQCLSPAIPNDNHILRDGMLLYEPAISHDNHVSLCHECDRKLVAQVRPPLSLSNNMWIGDIPHELAVLTLPERMLIAKYFPAAYIVKLFPKVEGAQFWDKTSMHSGIQGNVSTYRLDYEQIASMIDGKTMPPPAAILSAVIGVTFIGTKNLPELTLPDMFLVRRDRVRMVLIWLKAHNPLYRDIEISEARLLELPQNAVPMEILAATKFSTDVEALERERETYVPNHDNDHSIPEYSVGVAPAGVVNNAEDIEMNEEFEPAVIPLTANGIIDVGADDVPDTDILAHALNNTTMEEHLTEKFHIRRSSAFINEYARIDPVTGQRFDGGPSNANHLLGAFPVLFPYGVGGFEVGRPEPVPYETHARWAVQYWDKRFRKDLHFVFQVFGVIQKRRVCRSASLQIKQSTFLANQNALKDLKPSDLLEASREEHRRVPFSNPAVQTLRKQVTAVRGRIPGTDESRTAIRGKIWGNVVMQNPPNLWITINPPDTQDPIAQVMTGEEIDLDNFNPQLGPTSKQRAVNVAGDPYASTRYFHMIIQVVLEELFGIEVRRGHNIERKAGLMGLVNSYIGTVEAQGRSTLHLHLIMWLQDAPTAKEMKDALQSPRFREKVRSFIQTNIRADIGDADTTAVRAMPVEKEVSYSRPVDPRRNDYDQAFKDRQRALSAKDELLFLCRVTSGSRPKANGAPGGFAAQSITITPQC